jgi:4-diphosphocytidyl-2-C-methyl-D-erythritol kinase
LARAAVNDLEPVTAGRYAEISHLRGLMDREGAQISRMSGSGPSGWGLFKDETTAKKACQKLKNEVPVALCVSTISALKD